MAIICDIDGTIADHGNERGHFDWHLVHTDSAIMPIVRLVRLLQQHHEVCFVTGREESCREATSAWLAQHFDFGVENASLNLFMRSTGDHRDDTIVKRELYEFLIKPWADVELVLDDRDKVVAMWRELGLVCLQTRPGLF